jgi:flagellar biosynthesis/type III secretory pathway chaperone
MIGTADRLEELWPLWEEEVAAYNTLGQAIQNEWDALIRSDIRALASSLPEKESHLLHILDLQRRVDQIFTAMIQAWPESSRPKSVFDLAQWVPPTQAPKIHHYKITLSRLRQEIHQANERNKRFLQESLNFINDLFSLLTQPQQKEGTLYSPEGKKKTGPLPASWVSRKV